MIREQSVTLPSGISLVCRSGAEAPDGAVPRAMLVHGFPEAAFVWDEVITMLGARVACTAPQMRGYAGSSAPQEVSAYRAKHLVADLAGLIEHVGAPLDLLVAHDWGGAVAWALAAQRPELLRRLMIVNSPHPATFLRELKLSTAQQQASAYMSFLCRPDAEALLTDNDFQRLWPFFGDAAWLTPAVKERYRATWRGGLSGPLNYYRASPLRPTPASGDGLRKLVLDDAAVTVRVPTHILWGERDHALLPGLLEGLGQWVPTLTVERLPEASHWLVHEQPQRVAATILRLLAGEGADTQTAAQRLL